VVQHFPHANFLSGVDEDLLLHNLMKVCFVSWPLLFAEDYRGVWHHPQRPYLLVLISGCSETHRLLK